MSGALGAESPANAGPSAMDSADGADEALAESRGRLEDLAEASDEEVHRQRYWLYEHLWRLSDKANAILDEYEQDPGPNLVGDIVRRYFDPLKGLRADLNTYYWRRNSLMARAASTSRMSRAAATSFDTELLKAIEAVRDYWQVLVSAMQEYTAARQSSDMRQLGDLQGTTSRELVRALAAFVGALEGLVTTHGLVTQAAPLARAMGITPRREPRAHNR